MLLKLYFLWLGTCRGTDLRKLLITFNVNVLSYSVWKSEKKEALHLNLEGVVLVHDLRKYIYIYIYFSIWVFFHEHSRITGLQGKGEGIYLSPHYHFHPLLRHLDISLVSWVKKTNLIKKVALLKIAVLSCNIFWWK